MDPRDATELNKVRAFSFKHSSDVLAEVMITLMATHRVKKDPAAFDAISFGVGTSIAEGLWNAGKCETVDPEDIKMIEKAMDKKTLRTLSPTSKIVDARPPIIVYQNVFSK